MKQSLSEPSDAAALRPRPSSPIDPTASHRIRLLLMAHIRGLMQEQHLTQVRAAAWFGVPQYRISNLVNNKVDGFTVDTLINMLSRAGVHFRIALDADPRASEPLASRGLRQFRT